MTTYELRSETINGQATTQSVPAESSGPPRGRPRWRGQWIAPEPRQEAQEEIGAHLGHNPSASRFARSMYRRTFRLDKLSAAAPARVTADSRYVLWVNGHEVGRGPARSQPYRMRYDSYDLAPYLTVGMNVVAVLVTYYGAPTTFWQPAAANANTQAALVFEAEIGDTVIASDDRWKVNTSDAWTRAAGDNAEDISIPVEVFDARLLPETWRTSDFDDSGWVGATPVRATHMGAMGESRPPVYPFGRLLPRGISQLCGEVVTPRSFLDLSQRPRPKWEGEHPVTRIKQVLAQPGAQAQNTSLPAAFCVPADGVQHLEVDFGRIVAGFVEVGIDAPSGTSVELHYREKRHADGAEGPIDPPAGARFITRAGTTEFTGLEINGLRYLHLVVHAGESADVVVSRVAVREHLYPRTGTAYFRCDDPTLDKLYHAGVRTVQLNSFDAYTDCPTREQRAWVGDGVVHQLVDLVTNEDWGLARNYVDLGNAARPDGILPMVAVGDLSVDGGLTIPDWSLSWTHGVHVQYMHDGDLERALHYLPTVQRILQWYANYVDEHGVIADVAEWNLVDWSSLMHSGRSSILTALWARSLSEFAEIHRHAGNTASAEWAQGLYEAAAVGFEQFWDPGRGLYVDHIDDATTTSPTSQAANAVAIASGLAPQERWDGIITKITDPSLLVVRSWVGSVETGSYDFAKMREQMNGRPQPDWDVDKEIVAAQPFFSYVVHDAAAKSGRADLLPDLLLRWENLLGEYDTFAECWGWGTPVHGWSSTPARDLVAYVLGITPDLPGYRRARIAPRPGRLTELAGAVPSPFGPIEVSLTGSRVHINCPVPSRFVRPDGQEIELPAGTHEVDMSEGVHAV